MRDFNSPERKNYYHVIAKLKRKQNRDFGNHKDKLNSLVC